MLTKIKILLGQQEPEPDCADQSYTTYAKDLAESGNKSRPKVEDHQLVHTILKWLRGDNEPGALPDSAASEPAASPVESGILEQIKKKLNV